MSALAERSAHYVVCLWHGRQISLARAIMLYGALQLKAACETQGKVGGRKGYAEAMPETVALAKQLHAEELSYRKIFVALAERGQSPGRASRMWRRRFQKMLGR
jgi:hypothetical protein